MSKVQNKNIPSLLKKLVADKKLTQETAEKAVFDSTERDVSITTHLAQRKLVNESDLAIYNSKEFGLSLVDLDSIEIPMDIQALLPKDMMRKTQLYPLFRMGKAITIAVADPYFLSHLSDVRFATELMPEPVIVEYSKLQKLLNPEYSDSSVNSGMSISSDTQAQDLVIQTDELESEQEEDDSGVDVTAFLMNYCCTQLTKRFQIFISSRTRKFCVFVFA